MAHIVTLPAPPGAGERLAERLEAASPTGFAAFDERLVRGAPGCVVLQVPHVDVARAAFAHGARRLLRTHVASLSIPHAPAAPLFVEVGRRLHGTVDDIDPRAFADRLAATLGAERLAIFAPLPAPGTWDFAVAAELASSGVWLFLWAPHGHDPGDQLEADVVSMGARLDDDERLRWTAAVSEASHTLLDTHDVLDLERRLQALRQPAPAAPRSEGRRRLLARLALAGRAWPRDELRALVPEGADDELVELTRKGEITLERGLICAIGSVDEPLSEDVRVAAGALLATFPYEPWAKARAAVLLLRVSEIAEADRWIESAVKQLHGEARRELVRPWIEALEDVAEEQQEPLFAKAAVRALDAGDCEEALRLARRAMRGGSPTPTLSLLVAKAACAVGDLVQARVALEHARALLVDASGTQRDEVECELAELAYLVGDHEHASRLTAAILTHSRDPGARLAAHGIDGKLLLARGQYAEAERLFAEDAWTAETAGLGTPSRRARLNRAIALMKLSRFGEARSLFQAVHDEGLHEHDDQACAYALENLAYLASDEHAYGPALAHADEALVLRRRQGDRVRIVRLLSNIATFRRTVGLLDHADHAIRFARRTLGPGMPFDAAPRLGLAAARLHLDRGAVPLAAAELVRVLREGEHARDRGRVLGEAHRLCARVALEDGNTRRAHEELDLATTLASDHESEWENAFLRAAAARAEGALDPSSLAGVLDRARRLGDYEFTCESLVFAAEVYQSLGKHDLARALADEGLALRERVASSLSPEVRDAFAQQRLSRALDAVTSRLQRPEPQEELAPVTVRQSAAPPPRLAREIIGEDPAIRTLRSAIKRVARSGATVLIRGESGTGKELVAEALHRASERAAGPLVTVNCAALVETLLLSELFGHEKGAFTGAAARRRGRFELAEGGTLFLDEIGDISPRTQVALLRVLQEKTFERVGGTAPLRADVRIVCATHRDLRAMVDRGEFREDLYYRLRGITLEVPALRTRIGDLPAIAKNLLTRIAAERGEEPKTLVHAAVELLQRHRWPGNVRELENALRAASLFADGAAIEVRDFVENVEDLRGLGTPSWAPPPPPRATVTSLPSFGSAPSLPALPGSHPQACTSDESGELDAEAETSDDDETTLLPLLPPGETGATAVAYACVRQGSLSLGDLKRQIERDCIARALAETKGNITRAAALLGMKRPRLSQLVKQYGFAAISEGS
jgi:DNA-binding NtrC family response regulator